MVQTAGAVALNGVEDDDLFTVVFGHRRVGEIVDRLLNPTFFCVQHDRYPNLMGVFANPVHTSLCSVPRQLLFRVERKASAHFFQYRGICQAGDFKDA